MQESFVSAAAQALVLVFVVGPVLGWLKSGAQNESTSKSLNRFTLKTPRTYARVFLGAALAFEALMIFSYAYNGISFGDWDTSLLWLGHALALVSLIIWFIAVMQRLEVDGDVLRYRSIFGRTRQATFSEITRVAKSNQNMLVSVYASKKRFASLSGDVTHLNNFYSRCEKEGIPVTARERRPTTIGTLYRSAISVFIGIAAGISGVLIVIVIVLVVAQSASPVLLLDTVPACIALFIIIVGGCSVLPLRGILQIKRQERVLGFSFAREMQQSGARGSSFADQRWFIAVSNCNIIAFRRDYLTAVSASKTTDSGDECRATAVDGKKHKVRGGAPVLKEFRAWFNCPSPSA